jgi:hypothetical protein
VTGAILAVPVPDQNDIGYSMEDFADRSDRDPKVGSFDRFERQQFGPTVGRGNR